MLNLLDYLGVDLGATSLTKVAKARIRAKAQTLTMKNKLTVKITPEKPSGNTYQSSLDQERYK